LRLASISAQETFVSCVLPHYSRLLLSLSSQMKITYFARLIPAMAKALLQ
jgi:hypothetical protein